MGLVIRPAVRADGELAGRILYDAFRAVAERHGFAPDFASPDAALQFIAFLLKRPAFHGVVAVRDGRIVGSSFLAERDPLRAVGPVSVAPGVQGEGIGRRLMQAMRNRAGTAPGIRLVQDACNAMSMALYASLGFAVKEPLGW